MVGIDVEKLFVQRTVIAKQLIEILLHIRIYHST